MSSRLVHRFVRIVIVAAALGLVPGEGRATCGSANCFLFTNTSAGLAGEGHVVVDLSWRYVPMDRGLEGSTRTDTVLTPGIDFENETIVPGHHREISTLNSIAEMALGWGATRRLSVIGVVPLVPVRGRRVHAARPFHHARR